MCKTFVSLGIWFEGETVMTGDAPVDHATTNWEVCSFFGMALTDVGFGVPTQD